jgi:hypothetical protein
VQAPGSSLSSPFAWREIQLRALLDLGQDRAALDLAQAQRPSPPPAPQWEVIERITVADVLLAGGEQAHAEQLLLRAAAAAGRHRLPHQLQRITRIAGAHQLHEARTSAHTAIDQLCSRPVLTSDQPPQEEGRT